MKVLNIFLASSCSLATQRQLIGNKIREMSCLWECRGVRIRLNCWEDFAPEYMGTSKQEEYNGFLVKPSQIFIALLSDRVGYYTGREIDVALKDIARENVHCLCLPNKATPEEYHRVCEQLSEKNIIPSIIYDDVRLIEYLHEVVQQYIEKNYNIECCEFDSIAFSGSTSIYATITEDIHKIGIVTREQFGNMIRSLDDRLEEDFGSRCCLYPYNTYDNIVKADYYLSLLNDTYTEEEKQEIFGAFSERSSLQKPVNTFIYKDGKITDNHTELKELLKTTEAFSCEFDSLDTIKLTLFFHLYKAQSAYIDKLGKEFKLKDGRLYFLGNYLSDVSGLKNSDTLKSLEEELKFIDKQLSLPNPRRFDLWNRKTTLEGKITRMMLLALNDFLLLAKKQSQYDASEEIDYDLASQACHDEDSACSAYVGYNIRQKFERINHIVNHVEYIRQYDDIEVEIGKALSALYVNVASLTKLPLSSPGELLQVMFYMVSLSDIHKIDCYAGFEEDKLYGLIVSVADKYGVMAPEIEMVRINYANSFSRNLDHSTAGKLYLQAVENINKLGDATQYLRFRICHAYVSAVENLMEVDIHSEHVYRLLESYRKKVTTWSASGTPYYIGEGMYWASRLKCILPEDNLEELIHAAELAYENVQRYSPLSPEHHSYGDIYCYLPNSIAAFYMDFRTSTGLPCF